MMHRLGFCSLALALLFGGCGGPSTGEVARPPISDSAAASVHSASGAVADTSVYTYQTPSRDGTGKVYLGREISHVMGHRGAAWLERAERVELERPDEVVDSLGLAPDDVVADIGAGTGYFTFRIAECVPEGGVYAVDIQPEMLAIIEERAAQQGFDNVEGVPGTVSDPNLPEESVDVALIVDAYHEFSHPREMMAGLVRALRPGGRVVLIEYRGEDPSIPIKELHKMTEAQVRLELEAVGLVWRRTGRFLPRQHFLVFEKPAE